MKISDDKGTLTEFKGEDKDTLTKRVTKDNGTLTEFIREDKGTTTELTCKNEATLTEWKGNCCCVSTFMRYKKCKYSFKYLSIDRIYNLVLHFNFL